MKMMNKREGYYDVGLDIREILVDGGMIDELFYLQDLQQRKLFLNSEINPYSVADIIKHIMQYNTDDKDIDVNNRKPILLYITSVGGDVDSGFALIDVIKTSKTPVYTINIGFQYSMGFLIGLAGHKRFAFRNSKFLMHDGSQLVYNSGAKARDQMEFQRRAEDRIKQYVIESSKLTESEYDEKFRVEWYMFADEALAYGFTDAIIGENEELDTIV